MDEKAAKKGVGKWLKKIGTKSGQINKKIKK